MSAAGELNEVYAQAARETARGSRSFHFATRFLPAEMARAAHAVYWFCRHTDDLVDECVNTEIGQRDLDGWERALKDAFRTGAASHPVLCAFVHAARAYDIPHEYAFELIQGMRMDLNATRYRTFRELRVFCYRVASVVGLMMCGVFGFRDAREAEQARTHAIELGIAMQLTNILRDVAEDMARGRVYFPSEEMEAFGYSEHDLRARRRNDAFRRLIQFQIRRAQDHYARGNAGIPTLKREGRFAVRVASDVYREILSQIERADYDVFARRAVVPDRRKYWLAARNVAGLLLA